MAGEEPFRALIEQGTDVITILERDGKIRYESPSIERVLGYKQGELLGAGAFDRIHPNDAPRIIDLFTRVVKTPNKPVTAELRFRHKDGSWRNIEAIGNNLLDDPSVAGIVVNSRDITERKQAEEQIQFLARMIDQVRASVIATDMQGKVTHWNKYAEELFGWTAKEALGRPTGELTFPPAAFRLGEEITARVMAKGSWEGEATAQRRDGTSFPAYIIDTLITDRQGEPRGVVSVTVDIADRKEAEAALRRQALTFETLYDAIIITELDREGNPHIIDWSPAAEKMYGYSREEALGHTPDFLYDPEEAVDLALRIVDSLKKTGRWSGETSFIRKDGTTGIREVVVRVIADDAGSLTTLSVSRDITEHHVAQEALRESEASFRLMFANSPLPMWVYNMKTLRFLEVNEAAIMHYGYSREEFLSMSILDIRPPDDVPTLLTNIARGRGSFELSGHWRHRLRDGRIVDVMINSHTVEYAGQRAVIVAAEDITERIAAEEALRESEARYRGVVETSPDAITLADVNGTVLFCNQQAFALYGYDSPEELIGRSIFEIIAPEDRRRAQLGAQAALRMGSMKNEEYLLLKKDGTRIPAEISTSRISDAEGRPVAFIVITRDITERKAYQKKLEEHAASQAQLLHQLITAQEAERRRLSMDIHDGPLQSLGVSLVALDRAKRRYERGEHELAQKELEFLRTSLTSTVGEVRAVLADLSLEVLSTHGLNVALEGYIERFTDVTGIKVKIQSSIEKRLPPETELLVYRFAQEALANIRKHSKACNVRLTITAAENDLCMSIADDGQGFDPEAVLQHRNLGEGLGIRSMRERVQLAGGHLEIKSAPGEGATLTFRCPIIKMRRKKQPRRDKDSS